MTERLRDDVEDLISRISAGVLTTQDGETVLGGELSVHRFQTRAYWARADESD